MIDNEGVGPPTHPIPDGSELPLTDEFESRVVTRANHFVPQGLLRRWSSDGLALHTYSLLVPDSRIPVWSLRPIKSLAMHRDLYTVVEDGRDSDETEKWFAREVEQPGLEASERLINGRKLSRDEWHAVIRLYALQEMRTPQSFVEQMQRWDKTLPEILNHTLKEGVTELQRARAEGRPVTAKPLAGNAFAGAFNVKVKRSDEPDGDATLSASGVVGRRLWIAGIRHVLGSKPMERLLRHQWRVLTPAPGYEWPLTDHPALRLGYRSADDYSFSGGCGRRNADLMMPLSPYHLLHVQVGKASRGFHPLSEEQTTRMRSFLLKRADRLVFSTESKEWIPRERPRVVDRAQFESEREAWQRWHPEQSLVESESGV